MQMALPMTAFETVLQARKSKHALFANSRKDGTTESYAATNEPRR
jgi:hypothetical protein